MVMLNGHTKFALLTTIVIDNIFSSVTFKIDLNFGPTWSRMRSRCCDDVMRMVG